MGDRIRSVALVGVTGGAGTTRLTVESATALARDGRDVAVFDAAFATQGLAHYAPGRIDTDVTRLLTAPSVAPSDAVVDLSLSVDGRVAVCPAYASFTALADAKSADAADRFGDVLRETAEVFDHVLVDVPPVADNPSVAAVDATDRVALVAPASRRGADALPRVRDRLRDLDASAALTVANRGVDHPIASADVTVPESDVTDVAGAPACAPDGGGAYHDAVGQFVEAAFDTVLDVDFSPGGVTSRLLGGN